MESDGKIKSYGSVIMEILVVIAIFVVIVGISIGVIRTISNKAKVVSAKAQIAQLSLLLEEIKDDTGYYPVYLSHLTAAEPPLMQEKGWGGPYTREVPFDPWGSPYFYQIPPTTLFTSPPLPRTYGQPDTYTDSFETNPGKGILRIENYGITACDITLNGVIVVYEWELKNNPRPQIIEKEIDLIPGNNILVWARSTPGDFLIASISANTVPTREFFILGSYAMDKDSGGEGWAKDIVWISNIFPNFQR
ncbi:MAG: type II secretion system protein GspG [Candidatus Omnitrophica bacterium]|nr:type II secretion system protein GspG [Candidatus Omnitrophota bacterium]